MEHLGKRPRPGIGPDEEQAAARALSASNSWPFHKSAGTSFMGVDSRYYAPWQPPAPPAHAALQSLPAQAPFMRQNPTNVRTA